MECSDNCAGNCAHRQGYLRLTGQFAAEFVAENFANRSAVERRRLERKATSLLFAFGEAVMLDKAVEARAMSGRRVSVRKVR